MPNEFAIPAAAHTQQSSPSEASPDTITSTVTEQIGDGITRGDNAIISALFSAILERIDLELRPGEPPKPDR